MKAARLATGLAAGLVMFGCAHGGNRYPAAAHSDVTPYDALKKKFEIKSGQTYLAFMKHTVKPALDSFADVLSEEEDKFPKQYSKWQQDLIAEGQGVAIRIDSENYIFNIGYHDGSNATDDIKSGRSYGVGPTHHESDPSDLAYLSELENFYKSEPEHIGDFNEAILRAVFNCDTSGWKSLSKAGQILATDFIAIYTAESDRHIMVQLNPAKHPWEIDLAAATFASDFVASTGLIMKGGKLVKGEVGQWWAKGAQGSGIGETRNDRKKLTALISAYEYKEHSDLVDSIEGVIGKSKGHDVIQSLFEYLNAPKGPEKLNDEDGKQLLKNFLQYMQYVAKDADQVANTQ